MSQNVLKQNLQAGKYLVQGRAAKSLGMVLGTYKIIFLYHPQNAGLMLATSQLHTPGGLAKDAGSRRFHHQGAGGSRGLLVSVGQARCPAGRCQQAADVPTTSGWNRSLKDV